MKCIRFDVCKSADSATATQSDLILNEVHTF